MVNRAVSDIILKEPMPFQRVIRFGRFVILGPWNLGSVSGMDSQFACDRVLTKPTPTQRGVSFITLGP